MGAGSSVNEPNPPVPPLPVLAEGETEIRLSVYKIRKLGLEEVGGYHTGIVIRSAGERGLGREFAFTRGGVYENPQVECDPDPDYRFYQRVPLGIIKGAGDSQASDVSANFFRIVEEWTQTTYNTTGQNCNHFTSDICWRLLRRRSPEWINRLSNSIETRDLRRQAMKAGSDALAEWLCKVLEGVKQQLQADEEDGSREASDASSSAIEEARVLLSQRCASVLVERFRAHFLEHEEAAARAPPPFQERAKSLEDAYAAAAQSGAFDAGVHSAISGFDRDAEAMAVEAAIWSRATLLASASAQKAVAAVARDLSMMATGGAGAGTAGEMAAGGASGLHAAVGSVDANDESSAAAEHGSTSKRLQQLAARAAALIERETEPEPAEPEQERRSFASLNGIKNGTDYSTFLPNAPKVEE